jgi:hypothetical protein
MVCDSYLLMQDEEGFILDEEVIGLSISVKGLLAIKSIFMTVGKGEKSVLTEFHRLMVTVD